MKHSKWLLLGLLILPWLTLPLLGKGTFKKYLLAVLFMTGVSKIIDFIARKRTWWIFHKRIPPLTGADTFNFGPYFVLSFWLLKFTYKNLPLYLMTNFILHILFSFLGLNVLKRLGIVSLIKISNLQYLGIDTCRALLLYVFQFAKENLIRKPTKNL